MPNGWELVGTPGWPPNDTAVCHKIGTPTGKRDLVGDKTHISARRGLAVFGLNDSAPGAVNEAGHLATRDTLDETIQVSKREVPSSDLGTDVPPAALDWKPLAGHASRSDNDSHPEPYSDVPPAVLDSMPPRALVPRQAEQNDYGCPAGYHRTFMQQDPLYHQAYEVCCETGFTGGAMWVVGDIKCCSNCNDASSCTRWIISILECDPRLLATTASKVEVCKMWQPYCDVKCSVNGCT